MLPILNTILPVFLLIGLGAFLQHIGFFSEDFARRLSRLVYWVGLPCLLFDKITSATFSWNPILKILLVFYAIIALSLVLGFLFARWQSLSQLSTGAFVQACFRGNLGYVGLPVLFYAGSSLFPQHADALGALAVLTLAPTAPIYNTIAVLLMVGSKEKIGWNTKNYILKQIATNPLILSALAGILFASLSWKLPTFLQRTVNSLGNITIALALLSMGAIFITVPLRGVLKVSLLTSFIKVVVSPASGILLSYLFGLSAMEACVVVVFLAAPTSVSSFVFVEHFQGDERLAVNAVVLSTALSIFTLPVILWILTSLFPS